ncbi:hypothetical protein KFE25_001763 [Diacronema lutheri]|uniref:Uncharacterized protein n=1 Tax=Diacronema lutheri TaxID=2081491 RepID=A0A8J5XH81_DIALT|nr:hypothetical protein KFE25_001763 [Diacronema lutheri]
MDVGAKGPAPKARRLDAWLVRRGYGEARRSRYTFFYHDGSKPRPALRGASHELFFALTPALLAHMLSGCSTARGACAAAVYMLGWAVQYGVSSQFHRRRWTLAEEQFMSDLDHVGVLTMPAGTYFPLAMLLPAWRRAYLLGALALYLTYGAYRSFDKRGGRAEETALTIGMVLLVGPAAPELYARCTAAEWALHCAALAQYLGGGLAYAAHWPEPWPGVFGAQEVMHLATCTASVCTFLMNTSVVSRI